MQEFNIHYDMLVDYHGHLEIRNGIHSFFAKDESEAVAKAKKFFDNESVIDYNAIVEGLSFVTYMEQ